MDDLIEALNIFKKYVDPGSYQDRYPFNCSHDTLWVNVDPDLVSKEDEDRLEQLGFFAGVESPEGFTSFRFGSC